MRSGQEPLSTPLLYNPRTRMTPSLQRTGPSGIACTHVLEPPMNTFLHRTRCKWTAPPDSCSSQTGMSGSQPCLSRLHMIRQNKERSWSPACWRGAARTCPPRTPRTRWPPSRYGTSPYHRACSSDPNSYLTLSGSSLLSRPCKQPACWRQSSADRYLMGRACTDPCCPIPSGTTRSRTPGTVRCCSSPARCPSCPLSRAHRRWPPSPSGMWPHCMLCMLQSWRRPVLAGIAPQDTGSSLRLLPVLSTTGSCLAHSQYTMMLSWPLSLAGTCPLNTGCSPREQSRSALADTCPLGIECIPSFDNQWKTCQSDIGCIP